VTYADPERKLAYNREYRRRRYAEDPEFRERILASTRRYLQRRRAKEAVPITPLPERLDAMIADYVAYLQTEVPE
jgi:hypothetical protein